MSGVTGAFWARAMQMLARDAELLGHRHHRLADRRQHVLAQQRAGMRGLAVRVTA